MGWAGGGRAARRAVGGDRVKERDQRRAADLELALDRFSQQERPLPGIADRAARDVLVRQLIESLHRVDYPRRLQTRDMSPRRADPADVEFFDPIRGAVYYAGRGQHEEACWLVFLFVAYGKGKRTGWRLIRDIYGRLGKGGRWDWASSSSDPAGLREWIASNGDELWPKGTPRPFGAHRQHERVIPSSRTAETYVRWIGIDGHQAKFAAASNAVDGNPKRTFDLLYRGMNDVYRFGRLARFDYLAMLGKLRLANVEPGSTYMTGATGPVDGARLLFANDPDADLGASWLDEQLAILDKFLNVGMQAIEDALCNWQKSPGIFKPFRG